MSFPGTDHYREKVEGYERRYVEDVNALCDHIDHQYLEIESLHKVLQDFQKRRVNVERENTELRDALEFYANEDNYIDWFNGSFHKIGGGFEASSDADTGEIARAALGKLKEKGET